MFPSFLFHLCRIIGKGKVQDEWCPPDFIRFFIFCSFLKKIEEEYVRLEKRWNYIWHHFIWANFPQEWVKYLQSWGKSAPPPAHPPGLSDQSRCRNLPWSSWPHKDPEHTLVSGSFPVFPKHQERTDSLFLFKLLLKWCKARFESLAPVWQVKMSHTSPALHRVLRMSSDVSWTSEITDSRNKTACLVGK